MLFLPGPKNSSKLFLRQSKDASKGPRGVVVDLSCQQYDFFKSPTLSLWRDAIASFRLAGSFACGVDGVFWRA